MNTENATPQEATTPKTLSGQASPETIAEWKAKHGDIFAIEVGDKIGYVHKPDRKCLATCSALQSNPVRANEHMLNNCWLGGDDAIKTNNDYFVSVQNQLGQIIETKAVEIKKL